MAVRQQLITERITVGAAARRQRTPVSAAIWLKKTHITSLLLHMTYRHHSLRCHHRVQNTQGSNEHQLRITCQQCQGHLAIVYGRYLNVESRRLIQQHLDETLRYGHPAEPPPVQRQWPRWDQDPQPRARAAAAMPQPKAAPELPVQQEDLEVTRARMALKIAELDQEIRRRTTALEAMPKQWAPPPPPLQGQDLAPPAEEWELPEDMPRAQGSPRQHRPHP